MKETKNGWRPSVVHMLEVSTIVVLLLPIGGLGALRIYDTELIRQTEAELIAQAAFAESAYRHALLDEFARRSIDPKTYGHRAEIYKPPEVSEDGERLFRPIGLKLDLRRGDEIRPPWRDEFTEPKQPADAAARMAGERITRQVEEAQQITLSGMRLVDPNGVVVASTLPREMHRDISHREEIERALRGEIVQLLREKDRESPPGGLDTLSRRSVLRVFVALPILIERRVVGAVVFSRTPMTLQKAIYRNQDTFIGLALSLLLLALALALITSAAFVWPIRALVRQVRQVKDGVGDYEPIDRPVTSEVAELSSSIAEMSESLRERADYIRNFARSVSHEFKTPLTSMRGTVELLQDHYETMDDEKRESFLEMLERDTDRLHRLVERLHELARADVVRPTGESCDASTITRAVAARHEVDLVEIEDALEAPMDDEVFESIVSNLVINGLHHGARPVEVYLRRDRGVVLEVVDHGPGISEANRDKIFDEFFTTARDDGGTGLGLSIVRALIETHGGEIEVETDDTTVFCVRFRDEIP